MTSSTSTQQTPIGSGFGASTTAEEVIAGHDLHGRTAVVTGGYSGLGLETVRHLVAAGARVIVPARRPDLAEANLAALTGVEVVACDLADLASIARAGEAVAALTARVDLFFATAGVMASPLFRVGPGWEGQLGVNHLGHVALTRRLEPLLRAQGARVVVFSSAGHFLSPIRWEDPDFAVEYDKWAAYGQSKTANVLFALELDRRWSADGVRAFSLHPGAIMTPLQRHLPLAEMVALGWADEDGNPVDPAALKSLSQGAATGLWAAVAPELADRGGLYLQDVDVAPLVTTDPDMAIGGVRDYAVDTDQAVRLWEESARRIGWTTG